MVPFLVQIGLYVSPVAYSGTIIRHKFGELAYTIYSLNPMVAVIDGFRWAILGGETRLYWPGFFLSCAVAAALFWLGVRSFRTTEKTFADVI